MIKLTIKKNIDNTYYFVKDIHGKESKLMLELYGLESPLKEGDIIYLDSSYLEKPCLYSFGPLEGKYGRKISSEDDIDLMIIVKDNKEIYLKRYYG